MTPTERLDTAYCKLNLMSCGQIWIAAGCPTRLVLVRGISNAVKLTTRHYSCSWGSMGEFDDVENYLLYGKYPEEYTRAKKQICEQDAETTSSLRLEFSEHY